MVCELWFADPCSSLLDKRSHGGIDLKMKTIIVPTKWACSGIAENCNSEQASYAKTTSMSGKGEDCDFLEKEEGGRGCFEGKSIGGEPEPWLVMVSYWLSCGIFLLAELVAGQGSKVGLFPLALQLTKTGSV